MANRASPVSIWLNDEMCGDDSKGREWRRRLKAEAVPSAKTTEKPTASSPSEPEAQRGQG